MILVPFWGARPWDLCKLFSELYKPFSLIVFAKLSYGKTLLREIIFFRNAIFLVSKMMIFEFPLLDMRYRRGSLVGEHQK